MNSRQQGEAALEFAFALKNDRMKLYDSDLSRLKDEVKNLCEDSGKYIKLLKNILDIASSESWIDETSIWVAHWIRMINLLYFIMYLSNYYGRNQLHSRTR